MMVLLMITLVKRQQRGTTFLFGGKGLKRMHDSRQINEAGAPSNEAIVDRKMQPLVFLLTLQSAEYFQSRHRLFYMHVTI